MIRRRPGATRTDSLCPYTTRFRSVAAEHLVVELAAARRAGVDRVGGRLQHPLAGVGDDEVVALAAVEHREGSLAAAARLQPLAEPGDDAQRVEHALAGVRPPRLADLPVMTRLPQGAEAFAPAGV